MQKKIIPATFLTTALATGKTMIETEQQLYIIREETACNATNMLPLHSSFFSNEKRKLAAFNSTQEPITGDPNYYSSYE